MDQPYRLGAFEGEFVEAPQPTLPKHLETRMRFATPLLLASLFLLPGCGPKQTGESSTVPPQITGPSAGAPNASGGQNQGGQLLPPGR